MRIADGSEGEKMQPRDDQNRRTDFVSSGQKDRYQVVLQQFCDVVAEVDLKADRYVRKVIVDRGRYPFPTIGTYSQALTQMVEHMIFPQDAAMVRQSFSLQALRRAFAQKKEEVFCQYRMIEPDGLLLWMESRAFFLDEQEQLVCVVIRNITAQKEEERLRNIASQYDVALRKIYDELYELNVTKDTYRILHHVQNKYVNPPEQGVLHEAIQLVAENMIAPADKERFLQFFDLKEIREKFAQGKESILGEFRKLWTDGAYHWSSLTVFPVAHTENGDEIFLCFIMDIGDKKHADEIEEQNRLLKQQSMDDQRYRIIVEQTGTLVFEWSREQNRRYVSQKLEQVFEGSYQSGEDILKVWMDQNIVHPGDADVFARFIANINAKKNRADMTVRLKSREKGYLWCRVVVTCLYDQSGECQRIVGTINDVDDTVKSEKALKYQAQFDSLTGLYNTQAFCEHVQRRLREDALHSYAIIRMDINRFKFINDLYGIEEGDRLLRYIAQVLREVASRRDIYGRTGGDVFCLCVAYRQEGDLIVLTERIAQMLGGYQLGYKIIPSFGICTVDDRSVPVSILCDWANLAMKTVKGNLVKNWAFYDDNLRAKQLEERNIENEMEEALENGQFCIYLQPKHDLHTKTIVGAEALVRWRHPRQGLLPPGRFVPLFERNGFIVRLDEFVWEETCKILRRWLDNGYPVVPISVNVSRIHAYQKNFCRHLVELIEKYRLPHQLLELELTESTFIENQQELYGVMKELQAQGFVFSMDDFGSGYSSLNMLKNVPVDTIKLDREFLNETVATSKGQTVIQYTISMAKELAMKVVAEGVETSEQANFLMHAGCITAQGFYFSHPMPVDQFEALAFPSSNKMKTLP